MTIDDPELQQSFELLGITDPKDKQILLDYLEELFAITIEYLLTQKQNEKQHHPWPVPSDLGAGQRGR